MAVLEYNLFATDGYSRLPTDAAYCPDTSYTDQLYVWGFVGGLHKSHGVVVNPEYEDTPANRAALKNTATIPSPRIDCEQGDRVYITLINLGMDLVDPPYTDPHTVHLHGMHVATQVDGFPELSFAVPHEKSATYCFLAERPGTFMYHCHVEASEHVQMGMYGALVVYPSERSLREAGVKIPHGATNRNFAYNSKHCFYEKDYVILLSDFDSTWHDAVYTQTDFNPVDFKPDWWLVNGRAFPDTLTTHPVTGYESYVRVTSGQKFLLRMINMGYQVVPWHIHGWMFEVCGKDAHERRHGDMGFTQTIGSGETWDLLVETTSKRTVYWPYISDGQDGFPALMDQVPAGWWADIPVQGFACPPDPEYWNYYDNPDTFFPQCYPMHNHDDYKVTNNGVYPGGQLTFIQIDPRAFGSD